LDLDKVFTIEDVSMVDEHNNAVAVSVSTAINLSSIPVVLKVSFSGEESDLHLESESLKLRWNESNQVILSLKVSKSLLLNIAHLFRNYRWRLDLSD
jgi:hypothetical protein